MCLILGFVLLSSSSVKVYLRYGNVIVLIFSIDVAWGTLLFYWHCVWGGTFLKLSFGLTWVLCKTVVGNWTYQVVENPGEISLLTCACWVGCLKCELTMMFAWFYCVSVKLSISQCSHMYSFLMWKRILPSEKSLSTTEKTWACVSTCYFSFH